MFRFAVASALATAEAGTLGITYEDCGAKHAHVDDLQPTSIHTGRTETITGTGTVDEDVTSAQFTATVSALGAKLSSCSGDGTKDIVCHLPMGVGKITVKALSFPIAQGTVSIPVEVKTTALIPASLAHVDVHIAADEQNGESVICLDVHTTKAVSEETGNCCWGGSSCETAQNCHADEHCSASFDQCTGECAGMWCPAAPVSNRTTTAAPEPATTVAPEPATTAAPEPATTAAPTNRTTTAAPEPATTAAPLNRTTTAAPSNRTTTAAPQATGVCCWGGDSCSVAENCHTDPYCSANEDRCTGECAGMWCAEAPPTPEPSNATTVAPGPHPCDCSWAAPGCKYFPDDGTYCYSECCGNSTVVVV